MDIIHMRIGLHLRRFATRGIPDVLIFAANFVLKVFTVSFFLSHFNLLLECWIKSYTSKFCIKVLHLNYVNNRCLVTHYLQYCTAITNRWCLQITDVVSNSLCYILEIINFSFNSTTFVSTVKQNTYRHSKHFVYLFLSPDLCRIFLDST